MPMCYFLYCMHFLTPHSSGQADLQLFALTKHINSQKRLTLTIINSLSCFDRLQHYSTVTHHSVDNMVCQIVG